MRRFVQKSETTNYLELKLKYILLNISLEHDNFYFLAVHVACRILDP